MKPVRRFSNDLATEPNSGWNIADVRLLRELNPARGPNIQIFAYSEQEDEEPIQDSTIWCKSCNQYTLEYVDKLDAYFCTNCASKTNAEKEAFLQ